MFRTNNKLVLEPKTLDDAYQYRSYLQGKLSATSDLQRIAELHDNIMQISEMIHEAEMSMITKHAEPYEYA